MSVNSVSLSGNLTRDCEMRSTQSGTNLLTFGIAVNDRIKNANGEWENRPNYVDVVVFGGRANGLAKILKKGMKVCLSGKLHFSSWEKNGQRRSKLEVIADEVDIMQSRNNGGNNYNNVSNGYGNQNNGYNNQSNGYGSGYDDFAGEDYDF